MIAGLPDDKQSIVHSRWQLGMSNRQIAKAKGCSVRTVERVLEEQRIAIMELVFESCRAAGIQRIEFRFEYHVKTWGDCLLEISRDLREGKLVSFQGLVSDHNLLSCKDKLLDLILEFLQNNGHELHWLKESLEQFKTDANFNLSLLREVYAEMVGYGASPAWSGLCHIRYPCKHVAFVSL